MTDTVIVALMQLAQPPPDVAEAARGWVNWQFSLGDVGSIGSVIAAYVAIRERLARLEERVEPMWHSWNLRYTGHHKP